MVAWDSASLLNVANVTNVPSFTLPLTTSQLFSQMVMVVGYQLSGPIVTPPSGGGVIWSLVTSVVDLVTAQRMAIYTSRSVSIITAASVTFTNPSSCNAIAFIDVFSGVDMYTPIEAFAANRYGLASPTTQSSGTVTILTTGAKVAAYGFTFNSVLAAGAGYALTTRVSAGSTTIAGELANASSNAGDVVTPTFTNGWVNGGSYISLCLRAAAQPTCSLTADTNPMCGTTVTLTWGSVNAEALSIDQGIGAVAVPGGFTVKSPVVNTTYTLTASGAGGSATSVLTVTLRPVVIPDVTTGAVSNFNGGVFYAPGFYRILYLKGAFQNDATSGYTVNGSHKPGIQTLAFKITDGNGNLKDTPGNYEFYVSQAACEAGNAGLTQDYVHNGGPIGIYLSDDSYGDNVAGAPSPTFQLWGPAPAGGFTASASSVIQGTAVTLSWAFLNAASVTIDQGIGTVAATGSTVVHPTVTTTYTVTVTGGCITLTFPVTIIVGAPGTPAGLIAAGNCGGTIALNCLPSVFSNTYKFYRGTVSGGPYGTLVGTSATPSITDTPPVAGTAYYYAAKASDGVTDSPFSGEAAGASLVVPSSAPTAVVVTAHDGSVGLSWTAPAGVSLFSIYRSTAAGAETLLQANVTTTNFVDLTALNGTQYFYKISSANSCGDGALSAEVSATPQSGLSPYTPARGCSTTYGTANGCSTTYMAANSCATTYTQGASCATTYTSPSSCATTYTLVNGC